MSFLGQLKNLHAGAHSSHGLFSHLTPEKKPPCVVHPLNAPRTIPDDGFPEDFGLYQFSGAMIEVVPCIEPNGKVVRRPAMVARMVRKYETPQGGSVEEEMTATIADLEAYESAAFYASIGEEAV